MKNDTHDRCVSGGPKAAATPPPEIEATLSVLSGKWKLLIIWTLYRGTVRFNALRRSLPGVTQHTLSAQLRELEADGIVAREIFAEVPLRVEYSLTEHGRTLGHVLRALAVWGQTHLQQKNASGNRTPPIKASRRKREAMHDDRSNRRI